MRTVSSRSPSRLLEAIRSFVLIGLLAFFASAATAQVLLFHETFTDDSGFTKEDGTGATTTFFSDGAKSFLGLSDGGTGGDFDGDPMPSGVPPYFNASGTFLVTNDLDGTGKTLPLVLQWVGIDVSAANELTFVGDFAATNIAGPFDSTDFVRIEAAVDGGAYVTVLELRADESGKLSIDVDLDGIGDNYNLGLPFSTLSAELPVAGNSLDLRLSVSTDAVSEDIGFDDLQILGTRINDWVVPGPASFFVAGHWALGNVPDAVENAFVRNDGVSTADGSISGNPTSISLSALVVGEATSGSGTFQTNGVDLSITGLLAVGGVEGDAAPSTGAVSGTVGSASFIDAASLTVGFDLDLASALAYGDASVETSGSLEIIGIDSVTIADQVNLVEPAARENSSVTSSGNAIIQNVQSFQTDDDLDIADGVPLNASGTGTAAAVASATILFENITDLGVGDDLEIADGVAGAGASSTMTADVTFRDVANLAVANDLEIASDSNPAGFGSQAAANDVSATVRFETSAVTIADDFLINSFQIADEATVTSTVDVQLVDTSWVTAAGSVAQIGRLAGGGGLASNDVETSVQLVRSSMDLGGSLELGVRLDATPGTLAATLELDDGSQLDAGDLDLGTGGSLRLHLDGSTPVSTGGVGGLGTYSAVSVTDATLAGEIVAIFDFVPEGGAHTFDLLASGSTTALDDTTAIFTVEGLDSGFTVDFFGVVEDGTDVVRLMISGAPTVTDLGVSMSNGGDSVVAGTDVVYTIVANNAGPGAESAAVVTDVFPVETSCGWTSVASGGATGNTSNSGAAQLQDTLGLPVGASVTYIVTCNLDPSATGTLQNTVTIAGGLIDDITSNDSATDSDPILVLADLGITKDDGEPTAHAGDLRIYTLVASNVGPSDAGYATVLDLFPDELVGCMWQCTAAGDAGCTPGPVNGDLVDSPWLPAGSWVTYTAGCIVDPALDPSVLWITNTATISPPAGVTDPNGTNDSARDTNAGPAATIFADGFESGDSSVWTTTRP